MKDGAGGSPYINFAFPYSMMKVTTILITAACLAGSFSLYADAVSDQEEAASSTGAYSVAGALRLPENVTKRDVYGMNVGWKLFKGEKEPEEAASPDVDDSSWESVNLPNGIELLPEEASGCSNYQGPVWYRKTFIPPSRLEGRRNTLYFEGIMGKSEVWVNGEKAAEHFGGYLPVIVNLDKWLKPGQKNVIAVKADNSNDASYPPRRAWIFPILAVFTGMCTSFPPDPCISRTRTRPELWPGGEFFSGRNFLIPVPARARWG